MRRRSFWKIQTQWTRYPAAIESRCGDELVAIRIHPEHRPCERKEPASIFLTPQEAMSFAAYLSEQAEHLTAKAARAAARKSARLAAKEARHGS